MSAERFLVTGARGCIGAWVCAQLVREGVPVVGYDLGTAEHRLELAGAAGVSILPGDITDAESLGRALDEHEVTHVVHLAGLLLPQIKPDPPRGTAVNIGGTVNVLDAAKSRGIHLAYASSVAVFSPEDHPVASRPVPHEAPGHPVTFYGTHKQACEALARIYWIEERVPSIGLRPYIVYGPGRDNGLTASPTLAMAAAANGEGFRIAFGGRTQMQYAADTARVFIAAARAATEGSECFHLGGAAVTTLEVARAIEVAVPDVTIEVDEATILPFPEDFDGSRLEERIGPIHWTPLADGVRDTIVALREAG